MSDIVRSSSYFYLKTSWFKETIALFIGQCQFTCRDMEYYFFCFSRSKQRFGKCFQLADRCNHTTHKVTYINLYNYLSWEFSGILDLHRHLYCICFFILLFICFGCFVIKSGIAQTMSESP